MNGRRILCAGILSLSVALVALAVLEISFPGVFSLSRRIPGLLTRRVQVGLLETAFSALLVWPAFRLDRVLAGRLLESASRLGLGGMFVFASWFKIRDPQAFAMLVAQYRFLPQPTVNLFALFMPQLELWTGLLLILGRWTRESAALLLCMFGAFIVALAQAVGRNLGITCGCFELEGAMDKAEAWTSLVRDLILLVPTVWLLFRPGRTLWALWRGPQEGMGA